MNITMLHDLDTGFLAATLKPAFEALGHKCTIIQTITSYLEDNTDHIDYLLKNMTDKALPDLIPIFKETDFFIIRALDQTLKLSGILPYLNKHNMIYKIHGSDLRERNLPYSLRTWRINWHNKEPLLVSNRDPSLIPLYRGNVITQIERPRAFNTFPKRRQNKQLPFAITTPTNIERKGTQPLLDTWKSKKVPLHVLHGVTHKQALLEKSKASYSIDNLKSFHGCAFYHMNSVEAWFYKIPTFSYYTSIDTVLEPNLKDFIIHSTAHNVQKHVEEYIPDKKALHRAYQFAIHTHDATRIADQYASLYEYIQ